MCPRRMRQDAGERRATLREASLGLLHVAAGLETVEGGEGQAPAGVRLRALFGLLDADLSAGHWVRRNHRRLLWPLELELDAGSTHCHSSS